VILAAASPAKIQIYPIAETFHRRHVPAHHAGPAPMADDQRAPRRGIAVSVAEALGHVGVMAVEMFELADAGCWGVNEIAPAPYSGHYTYGACATSQFEQHIRAVCGVPLGDLARAHRRGDGVNLIGDLWADGTPAGTPCCPGPRRGCTCTARRAGAGPQDGPLVLAR